jgi:S-(hydroxymethyl)glutathione dehydrogenase/alcohol dehydrogenase
VAPDGLKALSKQLTGAARGFDYAFEAIGLSQTARAAYDAARRGGKVIIVGAGRATDTLELNMQELFFQEKTVMGSYYGGADVRTDFNRLLRLWRAGKLDLEGMITKRLDLADVNEAIAALRSGEAIRSVIEL